MVDTISNTQLSDLNYKTNGGPSLREMFYRVICARFYPLPVSNHQETFLAAQSAPAANL